jgi:hypothetical protein
MRVAARILLALAFIGAPLALAAGCGHGKVRGRMAAPEGADETQRAYELGYRYGGKDRDSELSSSYSRHRGAYDAAGESQFATGYADGYSRAANRYGSPGSGDWYTNTDGPDDDE